MIDKATAKNLVEAELRRLNATLPDMTLVIVDSETLEYDFGWVFVWDSQEHLETGGIRYSLWGNAPFIVDREDGTLHATGTAHPVEYYARKYEEKRNTRS